jgi:prepilin-type N-terminal cleavage/methylation domain-containing protein
MISSLQNDRQGQGRNPGSRSAFTLVEMLVVITILLVMMGVTVAVFNVSLEGERVRSGASQVQSYLAGARDRAAFAGRPCGVRFILDELDPTLVRSMLYIQVPDDWQQGSFIVSDVQGDPYSSQLVEQLVNGQSTTDWGDLSLLLNTVQLRKPRIMIQGHWYTVVATNLLPAVTPKRLTIRPRFRGSVRTRVEEGDYRLRLQPAIMPGQEPVLLPAGVAIDLDQCRRMHTSAFAETLPQSWYPNNTYLPALDILFSPNGTVIGPEASKGVIHLLVNDVTDATQNLFPIDPLGTPPGTGNQSDKRVVTLFTRTGYVTTSTLVADIDYPVVQNQFHYAERGETE